MSCSEFPERVNTGPLAAGARAAHSIVVTSRHATQFFPAARGISRAGSQTRRGRRPAPARNFRHARMETHSGAIRLAQWRVVRLSARARRRQRRGGHPQSEIRQGTSLSYRRSWCFRPYSGCDSRSHRRARGRRRRRSLHLLRFPMGSLSFLPHHRAGQAAEEGSQTYPDQGRPGGAGCRQEDRV